MDASNASYNILTKSALDIVVASRFELSDAKFSELRKLWIHGVQADTHAVGWLPTSVFDSRASTNEITAVYRDRELVGWCLRGESTARKVLKIYQIWVKADARVLEHGRALIDQLMVIAHGQKCYLLEAWVAEDLEANIFWATIGFQRTVWRWGRGKSLRRIFRWIINAEEAAKGGDQNPPNWAGGGGQNPPNWAESGGTSNDFFPLENYDQSQWRHAQHCGTL